MSKCQDQEVAPHAAAIQTRRGLPHLSDIRDSIKLLYKQLSPQTINSFSKSLSPAEVALDGEDIAIAVQSLAGVIVRHLHLPKACIIVNFRDMENAGQVELTSDDTYLVELHTRYRSDHRDVAAILAHEVTHVFLHRHGIRFPDTWKNELLTDTAAVYLGVGWPLLNAQRIIVDRQEQYISPGEREVRTTITDERLGYLTPDEFGYVLQKRALAFGEPVGSLIAGLAAQSGLQEGLRQAVVDYRSPPIITCAWWRRWRYAWDRQCIRIVNRISGLSGTSRQFSGYRFEISDSMRVIFVCPVCSQPLRLPTGRRVNARCGACGKEMSCST